MIMTMIYTGDVFKNRRLYRIRFSLVEKKTDGVTGGRIDQQQEQIYKIYDLFLFVEFNLIIFPACEHDYKRMVLRLIYDY